MPNIVKINSAKGLVTFSKEELADLDLARWIRSDSKGIGNRDIISIQPIEKAAAKVYKEKYPSIQVKIAEKCFVRMDGSLDIILRVAQDVSDGYYKKHPTKLIFTGDVNIKEEAITPYTPDKQDKKKAGLQTPIDFLEENIHMLSDNEKRQIFAELETESVDAFLNDLRYALDTTYKFSKELGYSKDPETDGDDDDDAEEANT